MIGKFSVIQYLRRRIVHVHTWHPSNQFSHWCIHFFCTISQCISPLIALDNGHGGLPLEEETQTSILYSQSLFTTVYCQYLTVVAIVYARNRKDVYKKL